MPIRDCQWQTLSATPGCRVYTPHLNKSSKSLPSDTSASLRQETLRLKTTNASAQSSLPNVVSAVGTELVTRSTWTSMMPLKRARTPPLLKKYSKRASLSIRPAKTLSSLVLMRLPTCLPSWLSTLRTTRSNTRSRTSTLRLNLKLSVCKTKSMTVKRKQSRRMPCRPSRKLSARLRSKRSTKL